jgi:hypothetical protein
MQNSNAISYEDYLKGNEEKKSPETGTYPVPETGVIPPAGDKIVAYMKSQFANQKSYFTVGIKSANTELPSHNIQ